MLMFFRNGDPKTSVKMIETKETNPRPMNSGDPHLRDCEGLTVMIVEADTQFRFWRGDIWTKLEKTRLWTTAAIVGSSSPIWNARSADEGSTNHQDDGSGDHWREYPLENLGRYQGHENFEESTDEGGSCQIVRSYIARKTRFIVPRTYP